MYNGSRVLLLDRLETVAYSPGVPRDPRVCVWVCGWVRECACEFSSQCFDMQLYNNVSDDAGPTREVYSVSDYRHHNGYQLTMNSIHFVCYSVL